MNKLEIETLAAELQIRKLKGQVLNRVRVFRRSAGQNTIARALQTEDFESATPLTKRILEIGCLVLSEDNARIDTQRQLEVNNG